MGKQIEEEVRNRRESCTCVRAFSVGIGPLQEQLREGEHPRTHHDGTKRSILFLYSA